MLGDPIVGPMVAQRDPKWPKMAKIGPNGTRGPKVVQNLFVAQQCPQNSVITYFWDSPYLNYSGHQDKTPFELACDKLHKILLLSGNYTIRIHVPGTQTTNTQDTGYEILFLSSDYTCVDTISVLFQL